MYACEECLQEFSSSFNRKRHQATAHLGIRHPCDTCPKSFSRPDKLNVHKRKCPKPGSSSDASTSHKPPKMSKSNGWTIIQKKRALKGALVSYKIQGEGRHPEQFLESIAAPTVAEIDEILEEKTGVKLSMCLNIEFYKPHDAKKKTACFWSKPIVICRGDIFLNKVRALFPKILKLADEFLQEGSGWVVEQIHYCELHFAKYTPLRGSTYIPLPPYIQHKRAVLNIQNRDNKCFLWSIIAANQQFNNINHPECVSRYEPYENAYNVDGIRFPVECRQIPQFERQNNVSVSVYGYDETLFPLYISDNESANKVNLLLYEGHYCLIRSLDRLLSDQRGGHRRKFFCRRCLFPFYDEERLAQHAPNCTADCRIEMSKKEKIKFENYQRMLKQPLICYADFECVLQTVENDENQTQFTEPYQQHVPCGYGLVTSDSCCGSAEFGPYDSYRGEDCVQRFLTKIQEIGQDHQNKFDQPAMLIMSDDDQRRYDEEGQCHICKKGIHETETKVRDHCHMCGKFRGPAHNVCNQLYRLNRDIVVVFHNLRRYDGHLIMQEAGKHCKDNGLQLSCIAKSMEDYLTFKIRYPKDEGKPGWSIRFIDSVQFLSSSLEQLVKAMPENEFKALERGFTDISLLLKKGVYPYDYMDTAEKFEETTLPPKESFYSKLNDQHITQEDYDHAKLVWSCFGIETMGEYHDLYLKGDTLQLADVMEKFRNVCLQEYGLDPMHYITLPGFAWDACLKITGIKLETIQDPDIYSFLEAGICGGISVISHRYAKANNPYCPEYDPASPKSFLMYWDVNNLYGWALIALLGYARLRFIPPDSLIDWATTTDGYILEVDLTYPERLHTAHSDYPLAPEKITPENLSPYCQRLKNELGLGPACEKLIPNLKSKTRYIIHIKNLQLYMSLGMERGTIYRVLAFEQSSWMEPYIMLNTRLRAAASSDIEKNLFKLMNNAVFGKTMESPRKYKDVRLVTSEDEFRKLVAKPQFSRCCIFNPDLVGVAIKKTTVRLDKPIYVGFSVLEISKTLMYDWHYNYMKPKYGAHAKLLFTDTDSFIYHIHTDDIYRDMGQNLDRFDTSNYPPDHPLYSNANHKMIGKMTDELGGKCMTEFVGLRSKLYSFRYQDGESKRAKGIKKATVANDMTFAQFKNALDNEVTYRHDMNLIKSTHHQVQTVRINKASLTPYDDKRFILPDGITTLAYGHEDIVNHM